MEQIIVTIDEQHLADIQTVANNLQFLGMTVDNILSVSGIITGSARRSLIPSLKAVPGVLDVEEDKEMRAIWHPRRRKTDGDSSPRHFFRVVASMGLTQIAKNA